MDSLHFAAIIARKSASSISPARRAAIRSAHPVAFLRRRALL